MFTCIHYSFPVFDWLCFIIIVSCLNLCSAFILTNSLRDQPFFDFLALIDLFFVDGRKHRCTGDFEAKISENPKWKCLMCNIYVQTGHCNRVNCDFAHGEQELRNEYPDNTKPMKVNYKTVLCNNFKSRGYCFHEDACNFAHGDQELNTIKGIFLIFRKLRFLNYN